MPTYEYECTVCHDRFERFQRMTEPAVKDCPDCGAPVRKVLHPPAIAFKGPGFHVNDYRKPGSKSSEPVAPVEKPAKAPEPAPAPATAPAPA